jgi:hypothetical protein
MQMKNYQHWPNNGKIISQDTDAYKTEPSGRMVRSRKLKYCVDDIGKKSESLVNLSPDSGELNNFAGDNNYNDILKQHRYYLAKWHKNTNDTLRGSID